MTNKQLRESIANYLDADGLLKQRIFNQELYPFFIQIIEGVFATLKLSYERRDYEDLKQDALLKILYTIVTKEALDRIKNVRNYCFMLARYGTIDSIRRNNTYEKFIEVDDNLLDENIEDEETEY